MTGWWDGIPAAQATVTCRGEAHRLRWEHGELRAPDCREERADLDGERCICGEILDAWAYHAGNLRVLTLASRGAADPVWIASGGTPWGPPTRMSMGEHDDAVYGGGAIGSADRDVDDPAPLLSLGGGLPSRLVATTVNHWRDRVAEAEPECHAALYGRLLATLRAWLNDPWLELELDLLAGADQPRSIVRDGDAVRVALPFAWLADVWVRDIAVIAGRLTLAAEPPRDGRPWRLTTISPELVETRVVELTLPR